MSVKVLISALRSLILGNGSELGGEGGATESRRPDVTVADDRRVPKVVVVATLSVVDVGLILAPRLAVVAVVAVVVVLLL